MSAHSRNMYLSAMTKTTNEQKVCEKLNIEQFGHSIAIPFVCNEIFTLKQVKNAAKGCFLATSNFCYLKIGSKPYFPLKFLIIYK